MDPITIIITALAAGATAALTDVGGQAIKDGYAGLRKLIQKRFADQPAAQTALEEHEKKPEVWKAPLEDALKETGADRDEAILAQARALLKLVEQAGVAVPGSRIATASGGSIATAGDDNISVIGGVQGDIYTEKS